jgi:hypothetical protein
MVRNLTLGRIVAASTVPAKYGAYCRCLTDDLRHEPPTGRRARSGTATGADAPAAGEQRRGRALVGRQAPI